MNLMEVDDIGRWNIVDNTYSGASFGEVQTCVSFYKLISPDDALIVQNIYIDYLIVYSLKHNEVSPL